MGITAPSAKAPLALGLESVRLSKLPETVAGLGPLLDLPGLLPVFSAAQQAPDEPPGQTAAQVAAAFQAQALAALTEAWADDAGLRARLAPALTALLESTVLPPAAGLVDGDLGHPPGRGDQRSGQCADGGADRGLRRRRRRQGAEALPDRYRPGGGRCGIRALDPQAFWTTAHI